LKKPPIFRVEALSFEDKNKISIAVLEDYICLPHNQFLWARFEKEKKKISERRSRQNKLEKNLV
jgi:hypothetical protein